LFKQYNEEEYLILKKIRMNLMHVKTKAKKDTGFPALGDIVFTLFIILLSILFLQFRIFRRHGIKRGLKTIGNNSEKKFSGGVSSSNSMSGSVIKELNNYKDYFVGFDTNILLNDPDILIDTSCTNRIILSKQVFDELDKKKMDENLSSNARRALGMIEDLQLMEKLYFLTDDTPFLEKNLNPKSLDERIIGDYLKEKNRKNVNV
jgi:hypothetical protein